MQRSWRFCRIRSWISISWVCRCSCPPFATSQLFSHVLKVLIPEPSVTRAPGGGWQDKHYLAGAIALEGLGGLFFVVGNDLGAQLLACAPHPRRPSSRARPAGAPSTSRVAASSEAPSGRLAQLIFLATVTPIMHDFWTIKDTSSSEYLVNMSAHPCASLSGPAIALARKPPDLIFHAPLLSQSCSSRT